MNAADDQFEREYQDMAQAICRVLEGRMAWVDRIRITKALQVLNADHASRSQERAMFRQSNEPTAASCNHPRTPIQ